MTVYNGGPGDNTHPGSGDDDLLYGDVFEAGASEGGDDTLYGGAGNDTLIGGFWNNKLFGGTGNDLIVGAWYGESVEGSPEGLFGQNEIYGDEGSDTLYGGIGNDTLYGGADNDLLSGDYLYGDFDFGEGEAIPGLNDLIYGGGGADTVAGFLGNDTIFGEAGDDLLFGDMPGFFSGFPGEELPFGLDNLIDGGVGADIIDGGFGNDTLYGGQDDDTVYGGYGNDLVSGDAGDDLLHGDGWFALGDGFEGEPVLMPMGDDTLLGGAGADTVFGGYGNDLVSGDAGNDLLFGDEQYEPGDGFEGEPISEESDTLYGGQGDDTAFGGYGNDLISGDAGNDLLLGDELYAPDDGFEGDQLDGADTLFGGTGADTLVGGYGDDLLNGGIDNDLLLGDEDYGPSDGSFEGLPAGGADTLSGGAGADTLIGGYQEDSLSGDEGNDFLQGDEGADTLIGGAGNDTLSGGDDADVMTGGAGADLFLYPAPPPPDGSQGEPDPGPDLDRITDFGVGDAIHVEGVTLAGPITVFDGNGVRDLKDNGVLLDLTQGKARLYIDTDGSGGDEASDAEIGIELDGNLTAANFRIQGDKIFYVQPSAPTTPSNTVDGVKVGTGTQTNSDGTTSTVITIPVVTGSRPESVGGNTVADIPLVKSGGASLLTAQVPTGLGMTVSGNAAPKAAGSSLTDLIREIRAHTEAGSDDQTVLTGGGSGFLGGIPADTPLLVQTIVPTAAPGATASAEPLVITGTPATAGNPYTALVIDTRGLPSGTTIQLQNVEFAAVIGAVRVTGGEGSQNVWGDGEAQYIVLGADDDTLHGGGGDDYVGSHTGNDVLYGDTGADTVTGGEDDDLVYGNRQDDIVYGNQGSDTLYGGQDQDIAFGGQDGDLVYGNKGEDVVYGNKGADTLFGGQADDVLFGGQENDMLFGNRGDDTLTGGLGADLFAFNGADGDDLVTDFRFEEGDRLSLRDGLTWSVSSTAAGDALLTFSDGSSATLRNVQASDVTAAWFTA